MAYLTKDGKLLVADGKIIQIVVPLKTINGTESDSTGNFQFIDSESIKVQSTTYEKDGVTLPALQLTVDSEWMSQSGGKIDSFSINGKNLAIVDKNINMSIQDSESITVSVTEDGIVQYTIDPEWIAANGSKIESITINDSPLPINNKTVDIPGTVATSAGIITPVLKAPKMAEKAVLADEISDANADKLANVGVIKGYIDTSLQSVPKWTVSYLSEVTDSITLEDNKSIRIATALTGTYTLSIDTSNITPEFMCELVFDAGETKPSFTYSDTIKYTGEDSADGVFDAVPGKNYNILYFNNAKSADTVLITAVVRGVINE